MIDLNNEAIPTSTQKNLLKYTSRLWADYTKSFGKNDSVGFSIISNINQDRYAAVPLIYGSNPPAAFDIHIYENTTHTAKQLFVNASKRLKSLGYGAIPWFYGDTLLYLTRDHATL